MEQRYFELTGNFPEFAVLGSGILWIVGRISGVPDHRLVVAPAALTGLVFNRFRRRNLRGKVVDSEILEQINYLIVSNCLALLLIFTRVYFRR